MALDDYVTITVTRNSIGITAPGFGTMMILGYNATWADRLRYYTDLPSMVTDGFLTTSPEYLAAQAAFSQTPRPTRVAVGRGSLKPTVVQVIGINDVTVGDIYTVGAAGAGVTSTTVSFTSLATLTMGTVTPAADTIAITAHGMTTGDGPYYVQNSGGGLPAPLTVSTPYWIIVTDANTIKLATSKANALALTAIDITTAGTGTQTIDRSSNDVVAEQLKQGLNAAVGANYTVALTGTAGSKVLTATGNAPGNWFALSTSNPAVLTNKHTTTDPGVATDLASIVTAQTDWYGLYLPNHSQAITTAAAAWVEANKRIMVQDCQDTTALATVGGLGGTGDTLDALATSKYTRTMGAFHHRGDQMMGAAWMGRLLPKDPGSATWKFKSLAGVDITVFTPTQKTNLLSRFGNGYEQPAPGVAVTFEGTVADGEYMDAIVGDDWVRTDMQVRVFVAEANSDKLEYEDTGLAVIEAAIIATLKEAVRRKIYVKGSYTVTMPLITNVSASDKSTRTLNNVSWTAQRSGAIHKVNVNGIVVL